VASLREEREVERALRRLEGPGEREPQINCYGLVEPKCCVLTLLAGLGEELGCDRLVFPLGRSAILSGEGEWRGFSRHRVFDCHAPFLCSFPTSSAKDYSGVSSS
jgi:hypothetical protein